MKLTNYYSSSVLIEDNNVKILYDPWLVGETHYGSWAMYPTIKFEPRKFDDVDYIWISHVHEDHLNIATLSQLNKDIPVLIHKFPKKAIKSILEHLGFSVIELEHNVRTHLKDNIYINILAGDDCNPEICGRLMGCSVFEKDLGTLQVDTISVLDNGKEVIANVNDCPFLIAKDSSLKIKKMYPQVDVLLVGYLRASSHPQCFDFDENKMKQETQNKQDTTLEFTAKYTELFAPKYCVPFAGSYTLAGRNTSLNKNRGEPELAIAIQWLKKRMMNHSTKIIGLNHDIIFDITTGTSSKPFTPIDLVEKQKYIDNVLSKIIFSYENVNLPDDDDLIKLLPSSYKNFEAAREKLHWSSDTTILIEINNDKFIAVSCDGSGYEIITSKQVQNIRPMLMMKLDKRLLYQILQGPQKAHWSTSDGGSHIRYTRIPDNYERGLYYCIHEFYSNRYN